MSMPPAASYVWDAIAPLLPLAGLRALRVALAEDDPALIQDQVCSPMCNFGMDDQRIVGADPIGFALWRAEECRYVGQLGACLDRFYDAAPCLVVPLQCYLDDLPREEMRRVVLELVDTELQRRHEYVPECLLRKCQ